VAQLVVRNLEEDVKARLQRQAKRHGRSMEDEVRHILRNSAREEPRATGKLGSRMAARFKTVGLKTDLPEWHGHAPRAADFDE